MSFEDLKRFIQRLILITITFAIIIAVGVQMVLNNPNFKNSLITRIPKVEQFLTIGQSEDFKPKAEAVFFTAQEEDYLVLSLQNKVSYPNIKLIMNGQVIGDFSKGYIKVNIKEGDYLTLDTRGLGNGLWFEVTGLSTNVSSFRLGQQFWIKDEVKTLGRVEGINKF